MSLRLLAAVVLAAPSAAVASELDEPPPPAADPRYERGEALPLGLRAERGETALITAYGGYDGGHKAGRFDVAAELHLFGPVYLRGGGTYVSDADEVRPTVGALVQLFSAGGLAGAVGVFYKPEGLTEPEGEIEGTFALGLRLEGVTLVANLTYGQDGEGQERDGEVRIGATVRAGQRFYVGADSRLRFSLGTDKPDEPDYDLLAGPLATVVAFGTAFTVQAGVSAVKVGGTEVGPMFLLGIGRVF